MVPAAVHEAFLTCARMNDKNEQIATLKELVYNLPVAHYHTLKFLIRHLHRIALQSDKNKVKVFSRSPGPQFLHCILVFSD